MRIEPAALAKAIGALDEVDLNQGLGPSVLQLLAMTKNLLDADGVGLMLVDAEGMLRWAAASDQQAEQLEQAQEALAQGPCTDAFWQRALVPVRDVTREGAEEIASVLLGASFRAALSVPVELAGGPIGTLDAYGRGEHAWNESEVSALQACAGVVANLLGHAVAAYTQGRLARQLQVALEHRVVIEQAKGALMEREGVDAAIAFERLRSVARSRHRTVSRSPATCWRVCRCRPTRVRGSSRPGNLRSSPTSRRPACMSGSPRCTNCWATQTRLGRSGSGPLGARAERAERDKENLPAAPWDP
jgi:hypothetical protein